MCSCESQTAHLAMVLLVFRHRNQGTAKANCEQHLQFRNQSCSHCFKLAISLTKQPLKQQLVGREQMVFCSSVNSLVSPAE